MSDNTIRLYLLTSNDDPPLELLATWNVPVQFSSASAYKLNGIEPRSIPNPTASWIAADGENVFRFQCGPGALCYETASPVTLGINASLPVRAIEEVDYNEAMELLLVHVEGVVRIQETQTALYVLDSMSWKSENWYRQFPLSRVTGVVRTYAGVDGQTRGRLMIALAPEKQTPSAVGLVAKILYDKFGKSVEQVTMMPEAAQKFSAHIPDVGSGMIYYWLIQTPYTNDTTKNAFLLSHGGSAQNALLNASTTFKPGIHWSSDVFLFDSNHWLGAAKVGLVVSGNNSSSSIISPSSKFDAWTPRFSFRTGYPEVILGNSFPINGFGMPRLSAQAFGEFSLASLAAKSADGCWYAILIDWNANEPETKLNHHQLIAKSRDTVELKKKMAQKFRETFSMSEEERTDPKVDNFEHSFFDANCRISNCDLDNPGDCPLGKCWARGAVGGFQCCKHPPV